jgi:hypothetical protein
LNTGDAGILKEEIDLPLALAADFVTKVIAQPVGSYLLEPFGLDAQAEPPLVPKPPLPLPVGTVTGLLPLSASRTRSTCDFTSRYICCGSTTPLTRSR